MPDTLARVEDQAALSIVIPVGPGETAHTELVRCVADLVAASGIDAACQIVLSHCDPMQSTAGYAAAENLDIVRIFGPPGRAAQLNRGVAASSGRCVWLLHADTRPTPGAMACAAAFAETGSGRGRHDGLGWFPLSFANDGPRLAALNAAGANLRSRLLRMPFGDQAWLLHRDSFEALGGFDEQFGPGEDLDFIRRARRAGIRLFRQNAFITTSARKYRRHGWLRTTLAHLWLTLRLWLKSIQRQRKSPN